MSEWKKYWQSIDGRSSEGGTFYNELKKLFDENKALKESRDELLESVHSFRIHLQRYHPEEKKYLLEIIEEKIRKAQALKKANEKEGSISE